MSETYINGYAVTVGTGGIDSSSTSLPVSTAAPVSGGFRILVESELILVVSGATTTTWTVIRAVEGTTAASHSAGAVITPVITAVGWNNIRGQQNGIGPYASKPTSGMVLGDRYKCTDSFYEYIYDGSVWQPFVFGYNVIEPVLSNFTQVNMGSSTLDTTHGGIIHYSPNNGNASSNHFLAIAIPSSGAYYVDAACCAWGAGANGGGAGCGLASTADSSAAMANHLLLFESSNLWQWERQLLNSPTSWNSNANQTALVTTGPLYWTRIYDDRTTNRTFYFSVDGHTWVQMYQESRTTLFTPAYAALQMNPVNCSITQHWVHFSMHT